MSSEDEMNASPISEGGCPDENALARFARGTAESLSTRIEQHLDGCESCRKAVAAAAASQTLPSANPGMELVAGMRFGRYEVERELGRGGMGVVFAARDVTLDRRVALKLLHAGRDEVGQARLLREAQVMAKLAHPNVVPVFELSELRGELYLVMELVDGVTLETWLKAQPRTPGEILGRFVDAGRGLAAAHAAGVVHRDFKPANVLVGADGRARVTDFGLSRPGAATMEEATLASPFLTLDGTILGTLAYMAPEQLEGKTADERTDQFQFCVALAEALSGHRPFEGVTFATVKASLRKEPNLDGVPRRLRPMLRRGLSAEPSKRFSSMASLLDALNRSGRFRYSLIGAGASLLAAGLVLIASRPLPVRAPVPAPAAAPQPAPAPAMVSIMVYAHDVERGALVRREDLAEKQVAADSVTTSVVKADSAVYVLGQTLQVPAQAGDPMRWSDVDTGPGNANAVVQAAIVTVASDLAEGTELKWEMLQVRSVPASIATSSVVKQTGAPYVVGHKILVPMKKGDALKWSDIGSK